jgi:hypothetical protein
VLQELDKNKGELQQKLQEQLKGLFKRPGYAAAGDLIMEGLEPREMKRKG